MLFQMQRSQSLGFVVLLVACDGSNVVGPLVLDATVADVQTMDVATVDAAETGTDVGVEVVDDGVLMDASITDVVTDTAKDNVVVDVGEDVSSCGLPSLDATAYVGVDRSAPDVVGDASASAPNVGLEVSLTNAGFTCVVQDTGVVRCVGDNSLGQLGDGTTSQRSRPVAVMDLTAAQQVAVGGGFACAALFDGTVRCWGSNAFGQLGLESSTGQRTAAMPVVGLGGVAQIAVGSGHACARLTNNSVRCWGRNSDGQLGNGTLSATPQPIPSVVNDLTARDMDLGNFFSCAVLLNGTVRCWGLNSSGQLGDGTAMTRTVPTRVSDLGCVARVSVGDVHACALLQDGTVRCWGAGVYGQLGNGSTSNSTSPVVAQGLSDVVSVSAGAQHTCAVLGTGAVRCWGANTFGQLGNGTTVQSSVPVAVMGITNAVQVTAGGRYSCARLSNGSVRCWGSNTSGQLGDGTTTEARVPVSMMF
jgi:alpha-tubulin suppressor-like RCC1 family protein